MAGGLVNPAIKVEIAFANNPLTALGSLTWTDVSRYVVTDGPHGQPVRCSRGRQHELSHTEAGRLSLRLWNADNRFSPWNSSSPYYGPYTDGSDSGVSGLVPMKRIRVSAVYASTTYRVWTGYITDWPAVWPDSVMQFVDIVAVDAFKILNLKTLKSNVQQEVLADSPTSWWTMAGATSGAVVDQIAGVNNITGANALTFNAASVVPNESSNGGSATIVSSTASLLSVCGVPGAVITSATYTIEAWVQLHAANFNSSYFYGQIQFGNVNNGANFVQFGAFVGVGAPIGAYFTAGNTATGASLKVVQAAAGTTLDNTAYHLVAVQNGAAAAPIIYINGTATTGTSSGSMSSLSLGVGDIEIGASSTTSPQMIVSNVVIYNGAALSAGRVTAHYNAGANGFGPENSGTRVGRILDYIGWPTADRTVETGQANVQGTNTGGQNALAYLQSVADSEGGIFFQKGDGTLAFYGRQHVLTTSTSNTSQITLNESAHPFELAGTDIRMDDLDLWNDIQVTRTNGVTQIAQDTTSQGRYGKRTQTISAPLVTTDLEAQSRAYYQLSRYKDPSMRTKTVTVHPLDDAANLFPQVLGRELMDRVTVGRTPTTGTAYTQAGDIEFIEHTITTADWHTTWRLSPSDTKTYWILGDATYGLIGTTTKLFY